jgi:hypothetical protein
MATTYAAYRNIYASQNSSRQPSTVSANSNKSASSKTQKVMNFLAPRMPLHEPLTPTAVANQEQRRQKLEREETDYQPARIYDSVLRRPLFQKAKKGNEVSITEKRMSSVASSRGKPSMSSSIDRVYETHLPGSEYFGMGEKN